MKHFLLILLFFFCACNTYAEIFKWVDADGKVHFSDKKPEKLKVEKLQIKTYKQVSHDAAVLEHSEKVVMYSTDWCGYCKKARQYFHRNNIAYTEYNIEKDSQAKMRYKKMGASGVPVIIVGNRRMNGFSEKGFERIY